MTRDPNSATEPCLRVTLKPRRSRPFFARHPWIFADSIARVEPKPANTEEVSVYSHEGAFIARGLINPESKLRIRLYRWDDSSLDSRFWESRIRAALELRSKLPPLYPEDNAQRLIFSEADGLSGLILDRLGQWLVCQWTSKALWQRRNEILPVLDRMFPDHGLICTGESSTAEMEGFGDLLREPVVLKGQLADDSSQIIRHGGIVYSVNLLGGQKTGFFLDQGVNRLKVANYASGCSVLDLFCYSGGFGLTCQKFGNAQSVLCVDSSKPAIALTGKNRDLNGIPSGQLQTLTNDVAKALKRLQAEERKFGLVICDPPKYARNRENLPDALKAYQRLNENAIAVMENGGILATFTCSGRVTPELFQETLARAAETQKCHLQALEYLWQPADHPVSLTCPESRYLFGMILRVTFEST